MKLGAICHGHSENLPADHLNILYLEIACVRVEILLLLALDYAAILLEYFEADLPYFRL